MLARNGRYRIWNVRTAAVAFAARHSRSSREAFCSAASTLKKVRSLFKSLVVALPRTVHLGGVRLPVFGLVATAGLLGAMWLARRTAQEAELDPDQAWDAGLFAVLVAFALSRLLLVGLNWMLFCAQPGVVLGSPSLPPLVLGVTGCVLVWWLRRKGLSALRVADAWAAPAALLLAVLQLGHFIEGSDAGMPTSLPWGVPSFVLGRVHPVQLYGVAVYGLLCVWLLRHAPNTNSPGRLAAKALVAGGLLSFFLSFFRQPYELLGDQYGALGAVLAGVGLLVAPLHLYATRPAAAVPLTLAQESR